MNTESRYLLIPAEGDVDEDEGLTMIELFETHLPHQMQDAKRFRMVLRLAEEGYGDYDADSEGPLNTAAKELAPLLDEQYPDAKPSEQLSRMLDALIEKFGDQDAAD